ncbi:MAG: protein kinase domain-containing protein [Egibacteraceae bacterium]
MRPWLGDVSRRVRRNPLRLEIAGFANVVEVSAGGFSTVYRADQPRFGRTVAVKVLHVRGLTSSFERECKALGMLGSHPNVVSVFDADIDKSGRPYIVMEYLPSGSLADRLKAGGSLPWAEVLAIGVKLAGTLESAHKAGVLHLDVKPANVLIGPDGEPKLADFGIARVRAALGVTTQTLAFTAGFAGPEWFEEGEPTEASDVYGLGATLFTLLVGHSPFLRSRDEEPNAEVVIGRMLFGAVPELGPEFPEELRALVMRAMAKKAGDRFGSAAEFGAALQAVQRDHGLRVTDLPIVAVPGIPPGPDQPPARHRRLAATSLLVAVMLVASVVWVAAAKPGTCSPIAKPGDGVLSFGTLLPKTGQYVYNGPALEAGAQLAINDIAAVGGIPGIAVKLDEANQRDEGNSSADTASQSTDALLSGGVDAIIGAATSAVTARVIDKVVCTGTILFSPSNTALMFSTYNDHGLYFRTEPATIFEGSVLGKLVVADGNSTVVVMSRNDAYGNSSRQTTAKAIEDFGGRVLDSFSYNPNASNYDRDIQRAKAENPDAIVLIGFTESAPILATMIREGLGPQNKRVYGTPANMSNTLARQVNPQDPGVLTGMTGIQPNAGSEAFGVRLKKVNPGLQDFTYAPHSYDAVVITALAAAVAGTDAPAAVAAQINGVTKGGEKCMSFADCMRFVGERKDIDYDGASGPLEFTEPGEPSSVTYVISEFQADGSLEPLRTVTAGSPT